MGGPGDPLRSTSFCEEASPSSRMNDQKHTRNKQTKASPTARDLAAQLKAEREKGIQEGRTLERLELAKAMLVEGHSFALVNALTGLSREQIAAFCQHQPSELTPSPSTV